MVAFASTSALCASVVTAFVRWSQWYPHSDNRQNWTTLLGIALAAGGMTAFIAAWLALSWRARLVLTAVTSLAGVLGVTVGFALLRGPAFS